MRFSSNTARSIGSRLLSLGLVFIISACKHCQNHDPIGNRDCDFSGELREMEWKREGGTIWLGKAKPCPDWAGIDAPSNLVRFASERLGDQIAKWHVNNYTRHGYQIVQLTGPEQRGLVFLVLPDRWVLLNRPGGLDYINCIVETVLKPSAKLRDPQCVAEYVDEVAEVYTVAPRQVLSKDFLRLLDEKLPVNGVPEPGIVDWMHGKEKNPEALRRLCGDPKVEIRGDRIAIQCNLMTLSGSVEEWILTGKLGKSIRLTDISVKKTREDGTFSWAYLG